MVHPLWVLRVAVVLLNVLIIAFGLLNDIGLGLQQAPVAELSCEIRGVNLVENGVFN